MCDNSSRDETLRVFVSNQNQDQLNKRVVVKVFQKTGIKIPVQKKESVLTLSRYVYSQNARHIVCPGAIGRQIEELNDLAEDLIVKNILNNLEQHVVYLNDLQKNEKEKSLLPYPERSNTRPRSDTHKSFDYTV